MTSDFIFSDLILLIGTNPLPNFVVADFFIQNNQNLRRIWLVHSENNNLQASTHIQAKNLEKLINGIWKGKHQNLQFPLEKIPISDVSNAREIKNVIQSKMLARMQQDYKVHLNYTGGTKSMSTHVYWILREEKNLRQKNFSYLDARNFRLIDDEKGVIVDNLRTKINISLKNIIELHGFEKCNPDIQVNMEKDINEFESILKTKNTLKNINGHLLEIFVAARLKENFNNTNIQVLQNWKIKKPDWKNNDFELDVMLIYGYQLIGISCAIGQDKQEIKRKGFEIIQRTRQIGGDEAKAVLVTSFKSLKTKTLNDELMYDTGVSRGKIIVLGYEDIKTGEFVNRIKEFVSVY